MSRYTGPSWKVSRRLGISLSGTGKELARRPYKPGQHGPNSRGKVSETKITSYVWHERTSIPYVVH